jgi:hypothetical protein
MNASPLQPNTTHGRATLLRRHDANKWLCRCACGEVYTRNRGVLLLEARDGTAACPKCRASIPKKERPRVPKALRQANLAMTCDMCLGYRHHMHMEASGRCVFDLVDEHGEMSLEDIGQHLDLTKEMGPQDRCEGTEEACQVVPPTRHHAAGCVARFAGGLVR